MFHANIYLAIYERVMHNTHGDTSAILRLSRTFLLLNFNKNWNFLSNFKRNLQILNLIRIRPSVLKLLLAGWKTERQSEANRVLFATFILKKNAQKFIEETQIN